jgi:hypothetical protein
MVTCVDGAATVHLCANGPVLLEICVVANDGWGICSLLLPDLVGGAVRLEGTEVVGRSVIGRVVSAHCEMNVISMRDLGCMVYLVLT